MMSPPSERLLPRNLRAQLQEHTAGGYLLFKIGNDGTVHHVLEYDDEKSYHAIMRKLDLFRETMKRIDEQMSLASMFAGGMDFADDEDTIDEDDGDDEEDDLQGF